jgi:hypothetical protein
MPTKLSLWGGSGRTARVVEDSESVVGGLVRGRKAEGWGLMGWLTFWIVDGARSKLGLYVGGVLYSEVSLSMQKVDVRPSLGNKMGDKG